MLFRKARKREPDLNPVIDKILVEMAIYGTDTEEYAKNLEFLERVYLLRPNHKPQRVSLDTIVLVLGNLLGILIIVSHERENVITSKGLGLLIRPR